MNEKSYRPTHRAVAHIALLHDASYKGCIQLSGPEKLILELLALTTNPFRFPGAKRYLSGKWQCTTDIHYPGSFPKLLISPALFLWRCYSNLEENGSGLKEWDPELKELWVFVHPAAFDEVYRMFEQLILKNLSIVKLTDLRRELCTFELNGPRSNAFLSRVLIPSARGNYAENIQKWNEWMQHTSSASLQPGIVLELSVQDPRISFPVKLSDQVNIPATNVAIRDRNIPSIWDHSQRERLLLNRTTESQIQQRRKKLLVPGSPLSFTDQDSIVPVLLIHRGCGYSCSEFDSGWSIILPKGWANDFWKSFIFAGIRIAGLREMHQISYEAGKADYPYEFVETPGFNDWNIEQRKNEALLYNRKPAKCRLATFEQHFGLELLEVLKLIFVGKAVRLKDLWTVDGSLLSRMASMEALTNTITLDKLKQAYNSFLKVDDWNYSIIRVRVIFLERGRPEKGAIIYRLNDQAFKSWKICEARMKNPLLVDDCVVGGSSALQLQPIGYVMTGNFHLDEGRGVGMGFCSFMACKEAAEWQTNGKIMVAVRNVRSSAHHFAVIQPVLL